MKPLIASLALVLGLAFGGANAQAPAAAPPEPTRIR